MPMPQMADAMLSEFLIAVFAGMVALVIMRKNTPRPVEVALWVGLIWVCILGVSSIHDRQARDLTVATFLGAVQIVGTLVTVGLQLAGLWLFNNRFVIADWTVLVVGIDLLVLALLTSRRQGDGWQPRVMLRDWMELPRLAEPKPVPVMTPGVEEVNQRFRVWAPVAAAAAATWTTLFLIWTGDVAVPPASRRVRKTAAGWGRAHEKAGTEPRRLTEQVVDIADLSRRAAGMRSRAATWLTEAGTSPEANWLGGFGVIPPAAEGEMEIDGSQRDRQDKLAS
jgi:hypothetical protein